MMDPIYQPGFLAQIVWANVFVLLALFVVAFMFLVAKRRTAQCGARRGWGRFMGFLMLVFLALYLIRLDDWRRNADRFGSHHAQTSTGLALPGAPVVHHQVAQVRQMERARQLEQAHAARVNELTANVSMHQLWDKLHTPRIKLDQDGVDASPAIAVASGPIAVAAPSADPGTVAAPLSEQTSESLAITLTRLEQLVSQTVAVADRVSEAGTLMGKAMIALKETVDTKAPPAAPKDVAAVAVAADVQIDDQPQLAAIEQRNVEIQFDERKLREASITFDRARKILGKDGFFRGNAVRFSPQEQRIEITGPLEAGYESRLAGTLLGSAGVRGRALHVSDVAKISPNPDAANSEVTVAKTATGEPPAWVDDPPKRVGNTWREVVVTGEYATKEECDRAADVLLLLSVYRHLLQLTGEPDSLSGQWRPDLSIHGSRVMVDGEYLLADQGRLVLEGNPYSARLQRLNDFGIGIDFVRREIAQDEYLQTVDRSFGPMLNLHTLIEFTPSVDAELRRRWNEYRRDERLFAVGAGAGSVLGVIGLVFGLLKVDTWTKGYYSKRLFLGVPAAIIGVLALLSMLGV